MCSSYSLIIIAIYLPMLVFVKSKVCRSLDVRNTPDHLNEFRDCRVIEGHLHLVLMENTYDFTDYYNRSFSELYEVTDYIIIYRLLNLPSLKTIFPNLTSIQGKKLFFGYALVLYDLPGLEEIGLNKFLTIAAGGVKIEKCPNVCYVHTVNWKAIGASHLNYTESSMCEDEFCPHECAGYCWNNYECQNTKRSRCDPACIGCTRDHSASHCRLCKYFTDNGTCVQTCPESKLTDNYASRCIDAEECISKNGGWSIFHTLCLPKCPPWFERNSKGYCFPSNRKDCPGLTISNPNELDQLVGCTHINGSLNINLTCYIDISHLEKCLGTISSISEYLKIVRTNAITTLEIFRELKVIKGEKLWSKYYALFVVQNQNLEKLWNDNFTLEIEHGSMIFQENPHLCESEIYALGNATNMTETDSLHTYANGYQKACDFTPMNIQIVENVTNVTLSWSADPTHATLGYTIYYIRAENDIDTVLKVKDGYDEDSCWSSVFVSNNTVLLKNLSPYTRYGYYIKTYFNSSHQNEETPIDYFATTSGDPSEPMDVEVETKSDTRVELKWKVPRYLNGNLTHYQLAIYPQEDYLPTILERDYCTSPLVENSCTCSKQDEIQLFLPEETCIGRNEAHYCNKKTVYSNESPTEKTLKPFKIQKRSIPVNNTVEKVPEITIPAAETEDQSYLVYGLKPFTMYLFYLKACNEQTKGETGGCGGYEMVWNRTQKREDADCVTNLTIIVDNTTAVVKWSEPQEPNSVMLTYEIEYKKVGYFHSKQICITSAKYHNDGSEYTLLGLRSGKYLLRVRGISLAGASKFSEWKFFEVAGAKSTSVSWLYGLLIVFAVLILSFLIFVIRRRYKEALSTDSDHLLLNEWMGNDKGEWKVDQETVEIIKELGQSAVGVAYHR